MATIPRITHIALHVADLDACVAFYQRFCGMAIVHTREVGQQRILWLAEPGRESDFIFVMMNGGGDLQLGVRDYRHFGFALTSRDAVDAIAAAGRRRVVWCGRRATSPFRSAITAACAIPTATTSSSATVNPSGPVRRR